MANRVMANLIKQLASLGRHAHDIFGKPANSIENGKLYYVPRFYSKLQVISFLGELEKETSVMQKRMLALEPRIDVISSEIQVWLHISIVEK